jgi:hypothetical protein
MLRTVRYQVSRDFRVRIGFGSRFKSVKNFEKVDNKWEKTFLISLTT